jgi:hypothetical protein
VGGGTLGISASGIPFRGSSTAKIGEVFALPLQPPHVVYFRRGKHPIGQRIGQGVANDMQATFGIDIPQPVEATRLTAGTRFNPGHYRPNKLPLLYYRHPVSLEGHRLLGLPKVDGLQRGENF